MGSVGRNAPLSWLSRDLWSGMTPGCGGERRLGGVVGMAGGGVQGRGCVTGGWVGPRCNGRRGCISLRTTRASWCWTLVGFRTLLRGFWGSVCGGDRRICRPCMATRSDWRRPLWIGRVLPAVVIGRRMGKRWVIRRDLRDGPVGRRGGNTMDSRRSLMCLILAARQPNGCGALTRSERRFCRHQQRRPCRPRSSRVDLIFWVR